MHEFKRFIWKKYLRLCAAGRASTMDAGAGAKAVAAVGAAPAGTGVKAVAPTGAPINGHVATGSR